MEETATTEPGLDENRLIVQRDSFHSKTATLLLIECVRRLPLLWHRGYMHRRALKGASLWEAIRQQHFPSVDVNTLKSRWKTMRDCYRRECIRSASSGKPSRWSMYEHLQFLDGHFLIRRKAHHDRVVRASVKEEPCEIEGCKSDVKVAVGDTIKKEAIEHEKSTSNCYDEVTFGNRFRRRLQYRSFATEAACGMPDVPNDQLNDFHFLASLTPCLSRLPRRENLTVRLKMLQLLKPREWIATNPIADNGC